MAGHLNNGAEAHMNTLWQPASFSEEEQLEQESCGGQLVCWWSPAGFSIPYCAFAAGLGESVRCCMQAVRESAPACNSERRQDQGKDSDPAGYYKPG